MGNLLSFFLSSACNPANNNPPCKLWGQLPQFPTPPDFLWSICVCILSSTGSEHSRAWDLKATSLMQRGHR